MNPVNSGFLRAGEVYVIVVVVAMLAMATIMTACRHSKKPCTVTRNEHYYQVDSVLRSIHDVDSLAMRAADYKAAGDRMGEMLACRYHGKALRDQSRFDEALQIHTHGLDVARDLCDTLSMSLALSDMGTDCRRKGDFSVANGYHYKALQLCDIYSDKESDDAIKARVTALNGIGNIEIELRNYASADTVLRKSLEGEIKLGRPVGIAINYANLGAVKMSMGQIDSAWIYYRKSMEYNQLGCNNLGIGLCHLHFGELHEAERRYSHAREEYLKAYDILKAQGDTWHCLGTCLALASVNIKLGEEQDARRYLQEAEQESRRINSKEHQAQAYRLHYELALLEGDPSRALSYYIHSDELMDSLFGLEKNDEMRSQRIEYHSGRLSGEVDVLNRDINNLKRMRNMQIILTLLVLLMAGFIIFALLYAVRVRNRSQRMLKQVEETRSLFFTNVVHMLRTPLTAIMGAIDVVISGEKKAAGTATPYLPEQRENMEIIERQGRNLLSLVDRILEVGSVRSQIGRLDWRRGDAVTFMRMVLECYRERCVERHIELTYASREDSVDIDTVPPYLSTIVGCLTENAINYSQEFCKITVTTHVEDGMFIIRVADDGMGISKTDLPHVFEPFYRGAEAEQLADGVGIGLTVVRDMTMAMGGSVAVDSMKGHGSVFTVKLPCKKSEGGVRERFGELIPPLPRVTSAVRKSEPVRTPDMALSQDKPLVLIVEDHTDIAHLVGRVLENDYSIAYATDGKQGLARAIELEPDVVITDVKMPLMDGCELCRQLRASSRLCQVPVIMLSARTAVGDRIRGIKAGADAYLVKPFVPEEMRAWVNRLIERKLKRDVVPTQQAVAQDEAPVHEVVAGDPGGMSDEVFLARFAALLDDHDESAGDKLNLDKMALEFKMGESQLKGRIRQLTGKNITAYVNQLRMEKAMRLLRDKPSMLIGDVAAACGFVDVAYFSKVFRRQFKMTPSQARNVSNAD